MRGPLTACLAGLGALCHIAYGDREAAVVEDVFGSARAGLFLAAEHLTVGTSIGGGERPDPGLLALSALEASARIDGTGLVASSVLRLDRATDRLAVSGSGTLIVRYAFPANARSLELSIGTDVEAGGTASVRVGAFAIDGQHEQLSRAEVPDDAAQPRSLSIPVAKYAGRERFLTFEIEAGTGRRRRVLLSAKIKAGVDSGSAVESPAPSDSIPLGRRPDILLIILDAARAGHFGCYGYRRDTTPNIDLLAAQRVLFRNAFSDCASTVCAIPSLLSGVAWAEVFQERKNPVARTPERTLAEYLKGAGYRTIAYSSNANNRLRQGFDEFYATWEAGEAARAGHGTYWISSRASEVIGQVPATVPLYLQLHYVPPHEPYDPLARFDLFSDPDYDGEVTKGMAMKPVRARAETLTPADLQQLIAYYDGNLRMADDAVSSVLEAWRESGRWHSSVIIVTADHGEAFREHGRLGHNTTVYDEMVHVPLIVKPPGQTQAAVRDRIASHLDVVPTLLSIAGLAPAPAVSGIDLLAGDGDRETDRILVLRSKRRRSAYAVRSRRFKAVFDPERSRDSELFDLAADPQELSNLAGARPLLTVGYAFLLAESLSVRGSSDEESELLLTKREREALRAIGYVDD